MLSAGSQRPRFYFTGRAVDQSDCIVFSRERQPDDEVGQAPLQLIGYIDYSVPRN